MQILVFSLQGSRHALPLDHVERVVPAAALTALPGAPAGVLGVLDLQGQVIPVFDLRSRLHLPARALAPQDQFLLARSARRHLALVIDEAHGVQACDAPLPVDVDTTTPLHGAARLHDGIVLIHDLERFISADEAAALDAAMERLA